MYKFLIKNGQTIGFGLGAVISILFIILVVAGVSGRSEPEMTIDALKETSIFDFGLQASAGLIILTVVILVAFAVVGLFKDFKGARQVLLGLAILAVLFLIFFFTSEAEQTGKLFRLAQEFNLNDTMSKAVSAGLKSTLVLAGLAILVGIFSELRNAFK